MGGPSGSLLTACAALLQRPRAPYTETGRHSTDPVPSRPPAWTPMGGSADACATGQRRNVTGLLRPAAPPSQTVHPGRNQRAFSPVAVRLMLAEDPGLAVSGSGGEGARNGSSSGLEEVASGGVSRSGTGVGAVGDPAGRGPSPPHRGHRTRRRGADGLPRG